MSFYILYFKTGTFYIINTFRLNSRFPQSSFPSHHPSTEPSNSPNSVTLSLLCSQRPLPGAMPSSKNHNCYKNNNLKSKGLTCNVTEVHLLSVSKMCP